MSAQSVQADMDAAARKRANGGPEQGHQFHFTVNSQGSYAVQGIPGFTDAPRDEIVWTLTVRAWDLPAALAKAGLVPISEWVKPPEDE